MAITPDRVREIFKGLDNGDGADFFKHVADDVDWTVMGTHPLAGHYRSKRAFQEATFSKLGKVLRSYFHLFLKILQLFILVQKIILVIYRPILYIIDLDMKEITIERSIGIEDCFIYDNDFLYKTVMYILIYIL